MTEHAFKAGSVLLLCTGAALALVYLVNCLLQGMSERRRNVEAAKRIAADRRHEEAEQRRLAQLVEWDNGLDVSKLEVKHEPHGTNQV